MISAATPLPALPQKCAKPWPIENEPYGSINLDKARAAIKADDFHFASTRLLSLENTIGGKVLTLDYQRQARAFCDDQGLQLHLDGDMRQVGILAAAGRIALEQGPLRLHEDHENAEYLSAGLAGIPQLEISPASTQTNIVYARCLAGKATQLRD